MIQQYPKCPTTVYSSIVGPEPRTKTNEMFDPILNAIDQDCHIEHFLRVQQQPLIHVGFNLVDLSCHVNTNLINAFVVNFDRLCQNWAPNGFTINTCHTMMMVHDEITRKMCTMVLRSQSNLIQNITSITTQNLIEKSTFKTKRNSIAKSSLH